MQSAERGVAEWTKGASKILPIVDLIKGDCLVPNPAKETRIIPKIGHWVGIFQWIRPYCRAKEHAKVIGWCLNDALNFMPADAISLAVLKDQVIVTQRYPKCLSLTTLDVNVLEVFYFDPSEFWRSPAGNQSVRNLTKSLEIVRVWTFHNLPGSPLRPNFIMGWRCRVEIQIHASNNERRIDSGGLDVEKYPVGLTTTGRHVYVRNRHETVERVDGSDRVLGKIVTNE